MSVLDYLSEYKAIHIEVPLKSDQPVALECVARAAAPPYVEAVFLPGQLPVDKLHQDGQFRLTFEAHGRPQSLNARIDNIVDDDRLRLVVIEALSIEQQREYFRVDLELSLKYGRVPEDGEEAAMKDLRAVVNLSGGGMWIPTTDPLEARDLVALQLVLPTVPPYRFSCTAQVVRMTGLGTDRSGAALKFVDIDEEDREEVVGFCFAEQRRQLRTKVRT